MQLGQSINVVQQRSGRTVDERFGDALGGHSGEDLLLGAQPNVAGFECIVGHDCDDGGNSCCLKVFSEFLLFAFIL